MLKLVVDLAKKVTNVEFEDLQLNEDKKAGSVFVKFELEQDMSEKITLALVYKELKEMRTEFRTDISELKTDVAQLKVDVAELKTDVAQLKVDVTELKTDVAQLKVDVAAIKACPTIQKELKIAQ
ncbi:hypothetical protein [Malacoplasma penetrans]|nr:hypothetical protein [Malacoplasma penetrans]